jgi:hypothetical protein
MAGRGTRATASDFNNIQSTVNSVLGLGSGTQGYGQTVTSSQVASGAIITVAQWTTLRADLVKCRTHQTNLAVANGAANISANRGAPCQTLEVITSSTVISEDIRDQYNLFTNGSPGTIGINAERNLANAAQLSAATAPSGVTNPSQYAGAWGVNASNTRYLRQIYTVTFPGYTHAGGLVVSAANHIRCFFNAGGRIQFTSNRSGTANNTKDTDWTNMLTGMGSFVFAASTSSVTGTFNPGNGGTLPGSNIGYFGATPSYQTLVNVASTQSKYTENRFTVEVQTSGTNALLFRLTWADNDAGDLPVTPAPPGAQPVVDEPVNGNATSRMESSCFVVSPNVSATVDVPAPTASAAAYVVSAT